MPKEGILLLVRLEKEWSIRRCARSFEKSLNRDSKGKIYFHLSVENVARYQGNEDVLQDPKALQFLLDRLDVALNRKFTVQIFVSMFECECLFSYLEIQTLVLYLSPGYLQRNLCHLRLQNRCSNPCLAPRESYHRRL